MNYSIIDIETTGGGVKESKITEIAIFRHDGEKIVDEFHSLVNPETRIPPFVARLTGITDKMVEDAPKFYEIANEVLDLTRDTVFVAHNVNFDHGMLRQEYVSLGGDYQCRRLCTIRLSRKTFPGLPSYSLGNLCTSLGIPLEGRHRAYGDARATVHLFERILEKEKGSGLL